MPKVRDVFTICIALVAGFIGGQIGNGSNVTSAASGNTVRATRFELVDGTGKVLALFGPAEDKSVAIRFFDGKGSTVIDIGTQSNAAPYLYMNGPDKKNRLAFQLTGSEARPRLVMSDRKWEGKIVLGNLPGDVATFDSDDWGLQFRAPEGMTHFAGIGMVRDQATGHMAGRLWLLDEHGMRWAIPHDDKP